jgi:acetate kinase
MSLTRIGGGNAIALPPDLSSHADIIPHLIDTLILPVAGKLAGVGHRVVHGGTRFATPVIIDADIREAIAKLAPLAPSHQPHNLAGIDAVAAVLPGVPQIACFDTAFHRTIPEHRQLMALPARFAEEGLRRFGFHGLSYQGIVRDLPRIAGKAARGRVVACHLGNGCSLAGIVDGKSQITSMGFTPLDGLVMGRRPGRLDPGAVLWLVKRLGGDAKAVDKLLNQEAGLFGVSGISPDMRTLLDSPAPAAKLAVAMFVDRLVQEIGAAAAAIGGVDALVFSGGIGENAAPIRAMTVDALSFLDLRLDQDTNARNAATISPEGTRPSVHVVPADEESVIAESVRRLVA